MSALPTILFRDSVWMAWTEKREEERKGKRKGKNEEEEEEEENEGKKKTSIERLLQRDR